MTPRTITLPLLGLLAGTRAAFGVGLGLLIAERLTVDARRGAGWALLAVGALSTVPLVIEVLGRPEVAAGEDAARPA